MLHRYLFLGFLNLVNCLTNTELSKFGTSGNFPEATVTVDSSSADRHLIYASGIPDHVMTAINNPNDAMNQNYNVSIPKTPMYNTGLHGCVPMGMIGITRTGVAIFNPLNADAENAVEGSTQEQFDTCDGHAAPGGAYHYHKIPDSCLYKGEVDEFIGVALDGFPIYGPRASDVDHLITSDGDDLDECHGREVNGTYRYHVTTTWPYFLGCYKGVVMQNLRDLVYTCDTSANSGWEDEWTWYFCNCPSGDGGGGYPSPEECRRDNPNRPPNCPNIDDCMDTNNPPAFCQNMCLNMNPPPSFCQNVSPQTGSTTMGTTRSNMVTVGSGDDHACSVTYHMLTLIFLIAFSVVIL